MNNSIDVVVNVSKKKQEKQTKPLSNDEFAKMLLEALLN